MLETTQLASVILYFSNRLEPSVTEIIFMSETSRAYRDEFVNQILTEEGAVEKANCFVCGSPSFTKVSEQDRYGIPTIQGYCIKCGHFQQILLPTSKVISKYYKDYYRKIVGSGDPESFFLKQKTTKFKHITNFLPGNFHPKTVLEIGCSSGGILSSFKDGGAQVLGLEFENEYSDYGRMQGIEIKNISVDDLDKKFDLIILNHVLEHIPYPIIELKKIGAKLSDQGILFIEVPSLETVRDGSHYEKNLLTYLDFSHVSCFSVNSFANLTKVCGLEIIKSNNVITAILKKAKGTIHLEDIAKAYHLSASSTPKLLKSISDAKVSLRSKIRRFLIDVFRRTLFGRILMSWLKNIK